MRRVCGRGCTSFCSAVLGRLSRSFGRVSVLIRLPSPPKGECKTGANPTNKGMKGTKRHLISDRRGIPLAVVLSAANVHDSMVFEEIAAVLAPSHPPRA
jgi:hypothetical protein